jgi:hypothetical protein
LACWAFSAFFFTVAEICSIEAEVCSRLAACSSVRCDRLVVLVEISAAVLATSRVEVAIDWSVPCNRSIVVLKSSLICLYVSVKPSFSRTLRLPSDSFARPSASASTAAASSAAALQRQRCLDASHRKRRQAHAPPCRFSVSAYCASDIP